MSTSSQTIGLRRMNHIRYCFTCGFSVVKDTERYKNGKKNEVDVTKDTAIIEK